MTELATREARAQQGVLQFAEEMKAIGDGGLYPNAGKADAWKTYCKERWGLSRGAIDQSIAALPVLKRFAAQGRPGDFGVSSAAAVATLPVLVQDAILADAPKRDLVKARAKAARKVVKQYERQELEPDTNEAIQAAMVARIPPKKVKPTPMPDHLKEENLPPKLRPEDHGWAPRKLAGEALMDLWRANEKLDDSLPPTDEDRKVMVDKVMKLMDLAPVVLAKLRGEHTISDDELYAMMERES